MSTLTACPGGTGALHTEHTFLPRQRLQASQDRVLCSSQPARDWKPCFFIFSFFHFDHHFFELKIIIPFLSPLIFFIVFSFLFFLPLAFSLSFLCFENGPWSLGIATRSFFSNPFPFFSFCFVSVLFWLFVLPLP